jgi:hypothetical protein
MTDEALIAQAETNAYLRIATLVFEIAKGMAAERKTEGFEALTLVHSLIGHLIAPPRTLH